MKKKIAIFVIPAFELAFANGGAENICRQVSMALSNLAEVYIFHAESCCEKQLDCLKKHSESLYSINSFYLNDWIKNRGEISPEFSEKSKKLLNECDVLVSFERVLLGVDIDQICVLGGVSYIHCEDVAKSKEWQSLIVPSVFVKQRCVKLGSDSNKITVISNGINCNSFFTTSNEKKGVALLPFRPDKGKGYKESVDFIQYVNGIGSWGEYSIRVTKLDNCDFSGVQFYNELDKYAKDRNVKIEYCPWTAASEMNNVYNTCDFVLSLGNLEEGFGLTTIETIMSGHAVVSKAIGATVDILPPNMGILFFDDVQHTITSIMDHIYNETELNNEINNGRDYIRSHYDLVKMKKNYCNFILNFDGVC